MTFVEYAIIFIIVLISSTYYKTREHVNEISQIISPSKIEQNKLQVVMQPKWFLNSIWIILVLWVIAFYVLISAVKWWSILYIIGCVVATAILSFIVPPRKKSLSRFFFRVTHKRYRQRFNYNREEEELLIKANDFLSKITGLKN